MPTIDKHPNISDTPCHSHGRRRDLAAASDHARLVEGLLLAGVLTRGDLDGDVLDPIDQARQRAGLNPIYDEETPRLLRRLRQKEAFRRWEKVQELLYGPNDPPGGLTVTLEDDPDFNRYIALLRREAA